MHPFRRLATTLLPFAVAISAPAQGAVEQVIPGRDFQASKLLTPGLTDTWNVEVATDEMLWCTVESGSFDPILELVDDQGRLIDSNDGPGTRSELWVRTTHAGKWLFRVKPFQGSGGGNYRYWLHRFRTQPLGTAAEAMHTFGKEQWWHWRVNLLTGDVLVPTVVGDGRLTAVLDAARNPVGEVQGGYTAPRDGDYFLRIEGPEGHQCQTMTQLARVGERALDTVHAERIAAFGLDRWRLALRAGDCLVRDLHMPEQPLEFEVRELQPDDRGPRFVATGHFDKGGLQRALLFVRRDAVMEVQLRNRGSTAVPYRLHLRRQGIATTPGGSVDGRVPLGDGVLHRLQLPAGEMLRVGVHSDHFDARLDVHDPDGNVIARADDRGPLDRDAEHTFLVTRPGTYSVLVYASGGAGAGPFALTTVMIPLPVLAIGQPRSVAPGDHLHLELAADETVWLSLRSRTFDAALQVVDPAGDAGFVAEGGGIVGDVLVAYRSSHAGRHTLLVHARSGTGGGELKVVRP